MTTQTTHIVEKLRPTFGQPNLRTRRAIDESEVELCVRLTRDAQRRVRVYSSMGFVPNNYRGRCDIQFVEAERAEDGEWVFRTGWGGAQRSSGRGSLAVVDGRGV